VPINMRPLLPLLEEPELKTNSPDTPCLPALKLRIITAPLVLAVPSPLPMLTAPPVFEVLRPEKTCTDPPAPEVPLPTVRTMAPARPAVEAPEPT
jgi:hypothetical protein